MRVRVPVPLDAPLPGLSKAPSILERRQCAYVYAGVGRLNTEKRAPSTEHPRALMQIQTQTQTQMPPPKKNRDA